MTIFNEQPLFFVVFSLLIGLLVGSFLNVIIYRLPIMMMKVWTQEAKEILEVPTALEPEPAFNLFWPASACPLCGHHITPIENIPLLSYLFLGGKCRQCKAPISKRYPLVELCSGVLSAWIAWYFGFGYPALALILLTWGLIAMTMIDIDHQFLFDVLVLPLLWLGLILNSYHLFTDIQSAIWGAVIGYMSLWSVNMVFKLIKGYDGMGNGDFKLLALFGAWGGWQILPIVILFSAFSGALLGIIGLLLGGKNKIPYGPYLSVAGWIALIWGNSIIAMYLQFSGIS